MYEATLLGKETHSHRADTLTVTCGDNFIKSCLPCLELNSLNDYSDFYRHWAGNDGDRLNIFHSNVRSLSQNIDDSLIVLSNFSA